MKKIIFGKIAYLLLAVILFSSALQAAASQTDQKLKDTGKKIQELKQQKEDAQEKVSELKEEAGNLQGELASLNGQLADVSAQMNSLEAQIKEKKALIKETGRQLAQAQASKDAQYQSMKLRIRFMYENGGVDAAMVLFESRSMTDFLNRAEYVAAIYRYDRQMLQNFEAACGEIAQKKKELKQEKKDLSAMHESMSQKQEEAKNLIAKTKQSLTAAQTELSDANAAIDEFEAQIAKMKAYEEELERKKAEEAKRRAQEQKNAQSQSNAGGGTVTANASDLAMLAALVECEAGGESYEGQLAVASVVVNRVRSGSFPNTVSGVIYQGGQFSPVASGRFAIVLARGASGSCTQAASAALSGSTNVSSLYFCSASYGLAGTVIGNHVFY